MRIVRRMYMKEFFTLLAVIALGLAVIFSLVDLADKIDNFMPSKPSAGVLALYSSYNIPKFLVYLLPMSVLICSLFIFSQASRRKEITAVKAAGGRLRRLYYPFVAAGVLIGVFAFFTNEFVVPDFSKKAGDLRNLLEGKGKRFTFNEGGLWFKSRDGSPVKIDLYVPDQKTATGVNIFVLGRNSLKRRLSAEKAVWDSKKRAWLLTEITDYDFQSGKISKVVEMEYADLESPEIFTEEMKSIDEMGIAELYRYIQRLKAAGFRNLKMTVDLNSKIAFPVINVFMVMLGVALSSRGGLGGGLFSAGLGLLISLLYWLGYTFSLSMGYAGIFHAVLSAWIVPIIFGGLSVYLFATVPE